MEDYVIIGWPIIQDIMDEEGFNDNATLIEPNNSWKKEINPFIWKLKDN